MAMKRPQTKATIKEEINHAIEELLGVEPDDAPCKIFTREAKMCDVLVLSKEDPRKLSCRTESGDAANLASVNMSRIRMLLHYKIIFSRQGLNPDDR